MLIITHALTGTAIGALAQNPILAFILGIVSHFILDSLPHFDQGSFYIDKDKGPAWTGASYFKMSEGSFEGGRCRDWIILAFDALFTLVFAAYIAISLPCAQWTPLICGAIGGLLPDIFDTNPFLKKRFRATRFGKMFHEKIHLFFHWPLSMRYFYIGVGIQVILVAIDMWFIKKLF